MRRSISTKILGRGKRLAASGGWAWGWSGEKNFRAHSQPLTEAELAALRPSIDRGTPFSDDRWRQRVAVKLGLESSLRPRGRSRIPKK